jgi:hypothetical protein
MIYSYNEAEYGIRAQLINKNEKGLNEIVDKQYFEIEDSRDKERSFDQEDLIENPDFHALTEKDPDSSKENDNNEHLASHNNNHPKPRKSIIKSFTDTVSF